MLPFSISTWKTLLFWGKKQNMHNKSPLHEREGHKHRRQSELEVQRPEDEWAQEDEQLSDSSYSDGDSDWREPGECWSYRQIFSILPIVLEVFNFFLNRNFCTSSTQKEKEAFPTI